MQGRFGRSAAEASGQLGSLMRRDRNVAMGIVRGSAVLAIEFVAERSRQLVECTSRISARRSTKV